MFVSAFSGQVTILSPNLDPKARALHVTFRLFFRPGTKRGPRGDQEVPKATKKRPWGSPGGAQGDQKGIQREPRDTQKETKMLEMRSSVSLTNVLGTVAGTPKAIR